MKGELHVQPGCGDAYREAEYWSNFNIIEDAVNDITAPTTGKISGIKERYSIGGIKGSHNGKGLQIIKFGDGTVRKTIKNR